MQQLIVDSMDGKVFGCNWWFRELEELDAGGNIIAAGWSCGV